MWTSLPLLSGSIMSSLVDSGALGESAHRYWRIHALENNSQGVTPAISADNIELRATSGGADQTTVATSALSDSEFSGSYINDYAFDGNNSQFWVSTNFNYGTHWIGYDFVTPVTILEVVWSKRPDTFGQNEAPTLAVVQYSDDAITWTSYWHFITPGDWAAGAESRTFTGENFTGKQHWRVRPTALQGPGSELPFSCTKLEFRGTAGGANLATGGLSRSKGALDDFYKSGFAFDASSSTFYISKTNAISNDGWLGYYFPTAVDINEVAFTLRNDGFGPAEALTAATVESSVNGVDWTFEWSFTTPATWINNGEQRVFTRP